MKDKYLEKVNEIKEDVLFLENKYYSKQKLDSLLVIKDKFKRDYWLENGKKAKEISDQDLHLINDDIVLPLAIFKIKEKNYEFYGANYDYSTAVFVETKDDKSINFTFNDDSFVEGISDKISRLSTGNYYYLNGKLKRTETIYNNTKKVGLFQQFDASGRLTLEINWDKDFKISEKQAENISRNEVLKFLKNKDNLNFTGNLKITHMRVHKILNEDNQPVWYSKYNNIEVMIHAKTGKMLKIFEEISIP